MVIWALLGYQLKLRFSFWSVLSSFPTNLKVQLQNFQTV
jgi:hypothetical protein